MAGVTQYRVQSGSIAEYGPVADYVGGGGFIGSDHFRDRGERPAVPAVVALAAGGGMNERFTDERVPDPARLFNFADVGRRGDPLAADEGPDIPDPGLRITVQMPFLAHGVAPFSR